MPKSRRIEFRVSENQYKLIKDNAQLNGYMTISSFLRNQGLMLSCFKPENNNAKQKQLFHYLD